MDKITASESFRARAMSAMIDARDKAEQKPPIRFNFRYASIAACAVLVVVLGAVALSSGLGVINSGEMAAGGADMPTAADTMAGVSLYPYPYEEDGFDNAPSQNIGVMAGEAFEEQKVADDAVPETTAATTAAAAAMWETTAVTHKETLPSATITDSDSFEGVFADYIDDNIVYVGEKKFTFYICNKTKETLDLNYYYSIEKMNADGEWVPDERELVFIDLLSFLESGKAVKFTIDTSYLTEGRYRVIKPVGNMEITIPFHVVDKDGISETTTATMVITGDEPVVVMTTSGVITAPTTTAEEEAMLNAYKIDDKASYSSGEEISVGIVNLGGGNAVVETLPKILKYSNGTYAEAGGRVNISSPGVPIEPNSAISLQVKTEGLSAGKYRAVFKMHNAFAVYDNGREDTLYIDFVIE